MSPVNPDLSGLDVSQLRPTPVQLELQKLKESSSKPSGPQESKARREYVPITLPDDTNAEQVIREVRRINKILLDAK